MLSLWKWVKIFFLVTLPVSFVPLTFGLFEGPAFAIYSRNHVGRTVKAFEHEVEMYEWMNWWSVPGATPIHDVESAPFHIVKLNSMTWPTKFNITKPESDTEENAPVDRLASLDDILKVVHYDTEPRSHWIYVTEMASPRLGDLILREDKWDTAFDELIQYHYVHPPARNATIHYVECIESGFLCGVWQVKSPALIHFTVENAYREAKQNSSHEYDRAPCGHPVLPVIVRVIEFPLDNSTFHPGRFPSEFDQLLSLTESDDAYELFDTYEEMVQAQNRFYDHVDDLRDRYVALDKVYEWGYWMKGLHDDYLPFETNYFYAVTFTTAGLATSLPLLAWDFSQGLYAWFMGKPGTAGTPIPEHVPNTPSGDENMWDAMLKGFPAYVANKIQEEDAKRIDETIAAAKANVDALISKWDSKEAGATVIPVMS